MNTKETGIIPFMFVCGLQVLLLVRTLFGAEKPDKPARLVYLLDVDGTINPALADYIIKGIEQAEKRITVACVIIRLDTPGGVVTTTKP